MMAQATRAHGLQPKGQSIFGFHHVCFSLAQSDATFARFQASMRSG
jgi:hypothetical protein